MSDGFSERTQERSLIGRAQAHLRAIGRDLDRMDHGSPDDITLHRLQAHCRHLRIDAVTAARPNLAEIAYAGETLFDRLARNRRPLEADDLRFLRSVVGLLNPEGAGDAWRADRDGDLPDVPMEVIGDGFDRLLERLDEAA